MRTPTDKQLLIADRWAAATGGDMWDFLAETAAGARSLEDTAFELRRVTGIKITTPAVRDWVRRLNAA